MRTDRTFPAPAVTMACAAVLAVLLSGLFMATPASAKLLITIDKSTQHMTVSRDGVPLHNWPVSTGTQRYDTPNGTFTPFRMAKNHFSREWDNAPMPHSIFFTTRGHAIHGTSHRSIGRPASHGCVRLSRDNARVLFDLVKSEGMGNTSVVLTGTLPTTEAPAVAGIPTPKTQARAERPRQNVTPRQASAPRQNVAPRYAAAPRQSRPSRSVYDEPPYERLPYAGSRYDRPRYAAPRYEDEDRPMTRRRAIVVAPRSGYWVRYPDGSRVFRSGDPGYRRAAPAYIDRRYGWN